MKEFHKLRFLAEKASQKNASVKDVWLFHKELSPQVVLHLLNSLENAGRLFENYFDLWSSEQNKNTWNQMVEK